MNCVNLIRFGLSSADDVLISLMVFEAHVPACTQTQHTNTSRRTCARQVGDMPSRAASTSSLLPTPLSFINTLPLFPPLPVSLPRSLSDSVKCCLYMFSYAMTSWFVRFLTRGRSSACDKLSAIST